MRQRQKHRHLTASFKSHNPRGTPSSVPERSAITFGDSNEYPSEITSNIPTKDHSLVSIIKVTSVLSETPTKDPSNVPNDFPNSNSSNMLIEYPSGYPTVAPIIMTTDKSWSNSIS